MKPAVIDVRITHEMDNHGLHLMYPLGLFMSYEYEHQRLDINLGLWQFVLEPTFNQGPFAAIYDQSMVSLYKFIPPEYPSKHYSEYTFWNTGKEFIFEMRIEHWIERL